MQVGDEWFIGYPSAVHYGEKGGAQDRRGKKAINQLLWGDWAKVEAITGPWVQIRARGRSGWVRKDQLQPNRLLEVNFIDVGQGDGCHIQTPDDKSIIIDAGEKDNMYRFLRWRFGKFARPYTFEAMIASHPDKDHYYGFRDLFEEPNVKIDAFYHNGIVEQRKAGKNSLGAVTKYQRRNYITGLVNTKAELKAITDSTARRGDRLYPNMLKTAVDGGRVKKFESLIAPLDWEDEVFMPGFAPGNNRGLTMRLLGPVPTKLSGGKVGLKSFGASSYTKNGHSVVLVLEIGQIKMLLGGDLNEPSQEHLLEHYTGLDPNPRSKDEEWQLIEEARKTFEVDVAKACHHGSAHVLPAFLQATNPIATVISSGDNESHAHPRPDTLGLIGKHGRGERPLIFSTELARSAKDTIKHPDLVRAELKADIMKDTAIIHDGDRTAAQKKAAEKRLDKNLQIIERSVANYGMINVRTDGQKMIMAQRLEKDRSKSVRWDIHRLECDDRGRLVYQSKH